MASQSNAERTAAEKHASIVEYLKTLPANAQASFEDILEDLDVNLEEDINVLDMLKSNPKIEFETDEDDNVFFQYARQYQVKNISELKEKIKKVRNGISFMDIENCYPDILNDCKSLIVGGQDIIACKHAEKKTIVLYPRGKPFYTRLSGSVTAHPGSNRVITSESVREEIRRGDAICIGGSWFRVSCSVGSGQEREQSQRSTAPLSVTSEKEMSDKNMYYEDYTDKILPLDGGFDGRVTVIERAKRHGVSNDIRKSWNDSLLPTKNFRTDEELENELIALGLVTVKCTAESVKVEQTKPVEKKKWRKWGKK